MIEIRDPIGKEILLPPLWPFVISPNGLRTSRGWLEKCLCFKVFSVLHMHTIANNQIKL